MKEPSNYLKHSNQMLLSQNLNSTVTELLLVSFSLNTGNAITTEGAIKLSEALKSNASLAFLNLFRNKLAVHFILTQYR
jgi:hypothetical protein